ARGLGRRAATTGGVLEDVLLDGERVDLRHPRAAIKAIEEEFEITCLPGLLCRVTRVLLELGPTALDELDVLDRERDVHVGGVLVLTIELGKRQLLDHRVGELPARALLVIEVGRDDRAVLAGGLALKKIFDPVVKWRGHRHPDLELDVLELGLAELAPA